MISQKRSFLATYSKLQGITSKSLTRRLIISYHVRDLTRHFFNQFLISKSEFSQQVSFFYFIYPFKLFHTPMYFPLYWYLAIV